MRSPAKALHAVILGSQTRTRHPLQDRLPAVDYSLNQRSLANQFLKLTQLLLNNSSHLFGPPFRLKIRIVSQFALRFLGRSFCVVKVAFNLLPCAVCHFFPQSVPLESALACGLGIIGFPARFPLVVVILAELFDLIVLLKVAFVAVFPYITRAGIEERVITIAV
jgi:hypothetical protein